MSQIACHRQHAPYRHCILLPCYGTCILACAGENKLQSTAHLPSHLETVLGTGPSSTVRLAEKLLWELLIQDCGYLCNMAVAEDYQRRGFGMALLRALERTAEIVRQPDVYLHLRYAHMMGRAHTDRFRKAPWQLSMPSGLDWVYHSVELCWGPLLQVAGKHYMLLEMDERPG